MQTEKAYSECPALFYSSDNTTEVLKMSDKYYVRIYVKEVHQENGHRINSSRIENSYRIDKNGLAQVENLLKKIATNTSLTYRVKKPVYCVETNMIFESKREAVSWLFDNGKQTASTLYIGLACNGRRKTAYGYHWKYINT